MSNRIGGGEQPRKTVPTDTVKTTQLKDTDYVDIPVYVPDGRTLKVWLWGCRTDAQKTPAGLTVSLYDHGAAAAVESASTPHAEGDPLASLAGPADASLRLINSTGGQLNAGAVYGATLE